MRAIVISSQFGHEIMAVNFAEALNLPIYIIPKKETEEEYNLESEKIYQNMKFFSNSLIQVPFSERATVIRDIIGELKSGTLEDEMWKVFFSHRLVPTEFIGPDVTELWDSDTNILFVPQKLISDGECGVTAQQQSLSPDVFNFLKKYPVQLSLGQHFNKVADLPIVESLAKAFKMHVVGLKSNPELLGLRGVKHGMYFDFYDSMHGAIGIAGTHTWYLLTMFPEIPQIIIYNKNGVERWDVIAEAAREAGYYVVAVGFDENTDMVEFSKELERLFREMLTYIGREVR